MKLKDAPTHLECEDCKKLKEIRFFPHTKATSKITGHITIYVDSNYCTFCRNKRSRIRIDPEVEARYLNSHNQRSYNKGQLHKVLLELQQAKEYIKILEEQLKI